MVNPRQLGVVHEGVAVPLPRPAHSVVPGPLGGVGGVLAVPPQQLGEVPQVPGPLRNLPGTVSRLQVEDSRVGLVAVVPEVHVEDRPGYVPPHVRGWEEGRGTLGGVGRGLGVGGDGALGERAGGPARREVEVGPGRVDVAVGRADVVEVGVVRSRCEDAEGAGP